MLSGATLALSVKKKLSVICCQLAVFGKQAVGMLRRLPEIFILISAARPYSIGCVQV
jgi:hypothetical protein